MAILKRTFSLPAATMERFEARVPPGRRSRVLTRLIDDWMRGEEAERVLAGLIEGSREMADIYLAIEREYHPLEEEVERALPEPSAPRRRRAGSARPRRRLRTSR